MSAKWIGAAAGLLLLAAVGCGGPTKAYVRGVKPLNENDRKESTPVDVRFYQLKDDARFKQAPVDKLWTDDKATLADDLIAMKTINVRPGTADDKASEVLLGEIPANVQFIGILALFPKEDDKGPRKMVLSKDDFQKSTIRLTGYHIDKE